MKKILIAILTVVSALFLNAAEKIKITDNGKPCAEIIIGEKPTRSVQFSAFELQYVVKLMTGAELPIVKKPTGRFPIILGGAKKGEFKREAYSVSVTPKQIVLKGNDSPDFGKVDYKKPLTYPKPEFNYHSTLYAVYDFLEYCAGVRFYSPGELGIAMKKRKTLEVSPFERKYTPAEQGMRFVYCRNNILYQLRMRCNKLYGYINHNAFSLGYRYWGKTRHKPKAFVEKRPEYFAKYKSVPRYDVNVRSLYVNKKDPVPAQMCMSNKDIIPHFADEALSLYKGKPQPGTHIVFPRMEDCPFIYPFGEQDGANWCECNICESRFPQVEKRFRFNYIHYDFANQLFREMKKRDPNMGLIIFAYHQHLRYPDPKIVKLDPGIAICMVIQRDEWSPKGETYKWQSKAYHDWIKKEGKNRYLFTWEHYINPVSRARNVYKYKFFPQYTPKDTAEFYKQHVKHGMQGCFLQIYPDVNPLEAYLIMRTVWDPDYDTEKVLDEYYRMMYAEAAAPMKAFFEEMERIALNPRNYPRTKQKLHSQAVNWSLGTHARMKKLDGYIKQAQKLVKDPDAKKRLDQFIATVWNQALQGRKDYDKRLSLEKLPPPSLGIAYIGKNNTPTERDWTYTQGTNEWTFLNTSKKLSAKESPKIKMICNDKDLFIRYSEKSKYAWEHRDQSMWFNGVEMFFAKQKDRPYYQVAVSTDGKTYAGLQQDRDGYIIGTDNVFPVEVLRNELKPESWTFTIKIPWAKLELVPGAPYFTNLARTRRVRKTSTNLAWSHMIPNTPYMDNLYRMGQLYLPQVSLNKTVDINGSFKKNARNEFPVSWRQTMPSVKQGIFIKTANNSVQLNAKNQTVMLLCGKGFPIRYGDKIRVSFKVWGSGKAFVRTSLYAPEHAKSIKLRGRRDTPVFAVPAKPETKTFELVVTGNLRWRDIYTSLPSLCAVKGAVVNFSDLKITVNPKEK